MTTVRFGRIVQLQTERSSARSAFRIGLEAVEKGTGRLRPESEATYDGDGIAFREGDVLFGKLRPNLRKAWLADRPGDAVGDFHVYRPVDSIVTSRYLAYVVLSEPFLGPVVASVYGAKMPRADWRELRNVKVWTPELDRQRAITDYLDRETAQIDAFISKNEELITLLSERRIAVLTEELFYPSTEWVRLKSLGRIRYGIGEPPQYHDDGVPLIRATNVNAGRIDPAGLVYVDPADIPTSRIIWLRDGDIVVVRSGALTGDSTLIPREYAGSIAGFDMVFRAYDPRVSRAIAYSLLAREVKEAQIDGLSARAAQPHLNAQELGEVRVPRVRPEDARSVATRIDRTWGEIDRAMASASTAIALARERRAALISAAVTGKIDVRGTA